MPNAAAARVTDQVKHSEAEEYRFWGAVGGALAGIAILGGLAALEIVTLGAATPLVAVVGTVLIAGGGIAVLSSAASNVAADAGRKVSGPDEGPIVTGIPSIHIGPERHVAAFLGSKAACNRHKHSPPNDLEEILQGSASVRLGRGKFHAARVGDKGTCGFLVGHGCDSVIIGGETITLGKIGTGDDPYKGVTDTIGEWGGYAALAGTFLLTLPVSLPAAILETYVGYKIGDIQSRLVNLIPDEETRDKVNLALAMVPVFHGLFKAARGSGHGAEEGGTAAGSEATGESGVGPENGGAESGGSADPTEAGGANDTASAPAPAAPAEPGPRAGRGEDAPPAANPVHQIGDEPGGQAGSAPPDEAAGGGGPAETPEAAKTGDGDPVVQQGDSLGGLKGTEEEGGGERPDLSPEENFPGQQSGNNCAPQSCQQIVRQATGTNHSEAEMGRIAEGTGAYDPATGTRAGGEADILNAAGVPAHTQAGTPENIQAALDNGQGVISGHRAGDLWPGDPNFEADPNNPVEGGHAVHTSGVVRDENGNVTHYVINDTGTGTAGRLVPADQYEGSLDGGPIAVTDAPIRTPAEPRPAAAPEEPATTPVEEPATAPEEPAAPPEEPAAPPDENPAAPEEKAVSESDPTTEGDPTVQQGDRPGGMEGGEDENGEDENGEDENSEGRRGAGTGRYGDLKNQLPDDEQANHLNQNAAFKRDNAGNTFIPESDGAAVGMKGNAFTEPGTPHYEFHRSLENFWNQYRPGGAMEGLRPTNAEYDQGLREALRASGLDDQQVDALAQYANQNRLDFNLNPTDPVPRVPGILRQRPPAPPTP